MVDFKLHQQPINRAQKAYKEDYIQKRMPSIERITYSNIKKFL